MLAARAGRYDYQCHDKICHNALFCDAADIIFILSFFFINYQLALEAAG